MELTEPGAAPGDQEQQRAERVPDPSDVRARLVRMTPRAEAALPVARREEARIEAEWEAHLGPERMGQLREALAALAEITDPYR